MREYLDKLRNLDLILMIATLILVAVGILMIFSISSHDDIYKKNFLWRKQFAYFLVGFVSMIIIACSDYKVIKKYSFSFYIVNIVLLILVLVYSKPVRHVHSWFHIGGVSFQPSEIAKLSTILMLASYLAGKSERLKKVVNLVPVFIIALIPFFLIIKQPDLGTAMIFLPVIFIMLYVGGGEKDYLLAMLMMGFLMLTVTLLSAFIELKPESRLMLFKNILNFLKNKKVLLIVISTMSFLIIVLNKLLKDTILRFNLRKTFIYFLSLVGGIVAPLFILNLLKGYQKERLLVFLDPDIDPLGSGYNIIQSKIAIGSGRIFGKGFLSGTQSQLGFLPEQQADFIFSVIGEELGLLGSLAVLILFVVIIYRGLYLICLAKDNFDFLVGVGILSLIGVQMLVNVGVATGIMPATGLPLPFVSYGGSSLCVFMLGIGILLGIKNQKY